LQQNNPVLRTPSPYPKSFFAFLLTKEMPAFPKTSALKLRKAGRIASWKAILSGLIELLVCEVVFPHLDCPSPMPELLRAIFGASGLLPKVKRAFPHMGFEYV
jgi:hypothetical protein